MAFVVLNIPMQNTEADVASVAAQFAGRPQPGDPLVMSGGITEAEHIAGEKSSGIPNADVNSMDARIVNVYDTYANALAYGATGLVSSSLLQGVNLLTGAADGVGITQQEPGHASGHAGPTIAADGTLNIAVDDEAAPKTVYLMSGGGRQTIPKTVIVTAA